MLHTIVLADAAVDEHGAWISLEELCQACQVEADFVDLLIQEDMLPAARRGASLAFASAEIVRVRRIRRLQHDFEASLPAVALMLDLIDEIERLRTVARCAGVE
jgi:chaperone modulatory protein CbpM